MIDRLIEKAMRKGYAVAATPKTFLGFTLPFWVGTELQFLKKKMCYTKEALVLKWTRKRAQRMDKRRKELFGIFTRTGIHPRNPYKF